MKKIIYPVASSALLLLPLISKAQGGLFEASGDGGPLEDFFVNALELTNDVLIPFVFGIGFLFFVWGMFLYFIKGGADEESQTKGRQLMIYATLGFVFIIVFWGIVNIVIDTFGFDTTATPNDLPDLPGTTGG